MPHCNYYQELSNEELKELAERRLELEDNVAIELDALKQEGLYKSSEAIDDEELIYTELIHGTDLYNFLKLMYQFDRDEF